LILGVSRTLMSGFSYFVGDEDTWFFVGLIFRICLLLSFWLLVQIEVGLLLEDLQKSPCRRMLSVELRFVLLYPRMSIVHRPKDCGPVPLIALFAFLILYITNLDPALDFGHFAFSSDVVVGVIYRGDLMYAVVFDSVCIMNYLKRI